ncbi:MAG: META domain-containing protein [Rikenellaceae bacterium]
MKKLHLLPLALLAFSLGCGTIKTKSVAEADYTPLENTTWQLHELNGKSIEAHDDSFTLLFNAEDKLNGKGSCNILFGSYTQSDDGTILIKPQGLTRAACPDVATENEYIQTLGTVTSYNVIDQTTLLLISGEVIVAKLEKISAGAAE